ncbi:MAG TPA: GIY-YIG nuclease family protein [Vicinamibacteria bacterium]|jgi:putative endonuclease
MPFVYLLRCRDGSLYAGAAKDLGARLLAHERGKASRYTRARLPVSLAYSRRVATWSAALREEHRLKQLAKATKEALVAAARKRRKLRVESRRSASARGRSAANKEKQ